MRRLITGLGALAVLTMCAVQAAVIASDSFEVAETADAANGVYQYGANAADGTEAFKNAINKSVVTTGFSGDWGGTGFVVPLQESGGNGYANIRMQDTASAYRTIGNYSAKVENTYYFSMKVSADTLLSTSQSAWFGFMGNVSGTIPPEGVTKYGFLFGITSDGDEMRLVVRTRQSDGTPSNSLKDTIVMTLNAGQDYNLIVRLDRNISGGTDGFTLWVNPTDSSEAESTAALVFDADSSSQFYGFLNQDDINTFAMYSGGNDAENIANVRVDDVIMATEWDDVYTKVVSEPAMLSLFTVSSCIIAAPWNVL